MDKWTLIGTSITYNMPPICGLVNQSIPGLTTSELLRILTCDQKKLTHDQHICLDYDHILMYIGDNDVCQALHNPAEPHISLLEIKKNIEDFIRIVKERNPSAKVHFIELAPRPVQYEESQARIFCLNMLYRRLCCRRTIKARQFSTKGGHPNMENYQPDGIHLTDDSLKKFKQVILKFMRHTN